MATTGILSNAQENAVLNSIFRNVAYSPAATVYLGLHVTDPLDDGSGGAEIADGNYARQAITFGAAAAGAISNSADVDFPVATVDYNGAAAFTGWGIYDAAAAGNLLARGALEAGITVLIGQFAHFETGDIDISLG